MSTEVAPADTLPAPSAVESSPSSATAPSPVQYTLLRVKRKRDESPIDSLLLSNSSQPSKRSALSSLSSLSLSSSSPPSGRLHALFKHVATTTLSDTPDDALLARIDTLQQQRRTKLTSSSTPSSTSHVKRVEASLARSSTAREAKVAQLRATPSSSFTFLDVSINRPLLLTPLPTPPSSLPLPSIPPSSSQHHKDQLFSRAMTIVKQMPEKEKMEAYASLLDDYWQVTEGQRSFVEEVDDRGEKSGTGVPVRRRAGKRIELVDGQGVAQMEEADDYVYDVYQVEDDDSPPTSHTEAGTVVIDSRVAGWFGLVLDDAEGLDSDEDEEDENRESWEGNDYPDEDEGDEEGEGGMEGRVERMEGGPGYDEDEEFYALREELKRSNNPLIAHSDDEGEEEDEWDDDDEDDEHDDDDTQYDREI